MREQRDTHFRMSWEVTFQLLMVNLKADLILALLLTKVLINNHFGSKFHIIGISPLLYLLGRLDT